MSDRKIHKFLSRKSRDNSETGTPHIENALKKLGYGGLRPSIQANSRNHVISGPSLHSLVEGDYTVRAQDSAVRGLARTPNS